MRILRKLRARGVPYAVAVDTIGYANAKRELQWAATFQDMKIHNMAHQGTVLGRPLWNVYYGDVAKSVEAHGFLQIVFYGRPELLQGFGNVIVNSNLHAQIRKYKREPQNLQRTNDRRNHI